jgi:murein DD-endopeptidase MepM/ murein hydrolase activator NlpD
MRDRYNRFSPQRRRVALGLAAALACAIAVSPVGGAIAQDLQSELDSKRAQLDETRQQESVLSTDIARYSDRIDQVAGEVATLRNREALVQEQLEEVRARLRREKHHLEVLKARLNRSLRVLSARLVAIYKSDEPDALTVILNADGFDDLLDRYEYLRRIEEQDASIVNRVRGLRDDTRDTVERVEAARDEIAARKAELERTRMELEAREAELDAVRDRKQGALDQVQATEQRLEGDIGELEGQIQAELQAAQSETATPLPAGPIQGESASGFIWPVNGPVVSPFGMRWGRLHAGIDIAVPAGTPIRASKAGTIALAAPYGGYGNYTCIDHGGGISSCYAHQSSFAATSGSVSQGQVIGYVGCTGHCFGDHLHFEIRVNGAPTDPLGYL